MRRTILLSLVVISAALAVVFGAGTFAAFTDTTSVAGNVTAATIDIVDNTSTADGTTAAPNSLVLFAPQNLLPGETSTSVNSLKNNGNRDFQLTWTETISVTGGGAGCTNAMATATETIADTDGHADSPANTSGGVFIADGQTVAFTVVFELLSTADEDCQGATFKVQYDFTATGVAD